MLSRRTFLKTSSLVSLSPWVPSMLATSARAAAEPDGRVLVVVQLDGGNDGINTVVPYADDAYGRNRDKLRLDASRVLRINEYAGLHPGMTAAKELFDEGRLAIVQGVGYPNPSRSHFRSMRIWQTARFDDDEHDGYGWLGSALDRPAAGADGGAEAAAIYVGEEETPVALWGRRSTATSLSRAADLELQFDGAGAAPSETTGRSIDQFVTRQVLSAYAAADEFAQRKGQKKNGPDPSYPDTELAARLQLVSQLLQSGSHARVFYTMQSGYDTHSNQLATHDRLLREFAGALKPFLTDLRASRLDDRVVVLAFSEFGRRVKENDSQGTDHGAAGPVFLAGAPVRGGLIGDTPDLSQLDDGDLRATIDFRQIYATILDEWLGISAQDILGARFESLPIFGV